MRYLYIIGGLIVLGLAGLNYNLFKLTKEVRAMANQIDESLDRIEQATTAEKEQVGELVAEVRRLREGQTITPEQMARLNALADGVAGIYTPDAGQGGGPSETPGQT